MTNNCCLVQRSARLGQATSGSEFISPGRPAHRAREGLQGEEGEGGAGGEKGRWPWREGRRQPQHYPPRLEAAGCSKPFSRGLSCAWHCAGQQAPMHYTRSGQSRAGTGKTEKDREWGCEGSQGELPREGSISKGNEGSTSAQAGCLRVGGDSWLHVAVT